MRRIEEPTCDGQCVDQVMRLNTHRLGVGVRGDTKPRRAAREPTGVRSSVRPPNHKRALGEGAPRIDGEAARSEAVRLQPPNHRRLGLKGAHCNQGYPCLHLHLVREHARVECLDPLWLQKREGVSRRQNDMRMLGAPPREREEAALQHHALFESILQKVGSRRQEGKRQHRKKECEQMAAMNTTPAA